MPDHPWQDMSYGFHARLPKSIRKYNFIFVVDHFSKMAHFLPCIKTSDAFKIAQFYFDRGVKLYDLPKTIMSDMDVKFMSYFWKTLWHKIWTKMVNRSLGNLL